MNAVSLAVASIRSRPLNAALCGLAAAAGIALLCAVFLLSQAVAAGFVRNAHGIDVIAGTKGSPLQLVMSSIYHADVPAGNIDMADYEQLAHNPHVRQAIPLALGDNYKGFRMVGTTPDYPALYDADVAQGQMFSAPFETVAGALTGLEIGERFAVSHGFSADNDDLHDDRLYTVTGILKPTGTVLDRIFLTPLESVQQLHAHHEEHEAEEETEAAMAHQVTAVLIKVRGPADIMNLPRQINQSPNIMAAVPSYEMARFAKSLGMGRSLMIILGSGFVALSALMLLASLASSLALRRYDLAVLRVLGATPGRLSATVMAEGLLLSGAGAVAGIVLGHLIAYGAALSIETLKGIVLPETLLIPQPLDAGLLLLGLFTGLLAALVPSFSVARTDIAGLLAKGRA
jgi:putative ABC transport system permease protein